MRPQRRSFSVLTKLVLSVAILVAIVVAAMGTFDLLAMLRVYDAESKRQEEQGSTAIRRNGEGMGSKLAAGIAPALAEVNYSLIQEALDETLKADPAVLNVEVVDDTATVVARSGRGVLSSGKTKLLVDKSGKVPPPENAQVAGERALRFVTPVSYGGKTRGELHYAYSLRELDEQLKKLREEREVTTRRSVVRSVMVGSLCLLFGLLLAIAQGLQVTRPVRALAQRATQIASGDLSARVTLKTNDEFGHLGATFNHMADRIQNLLQETADKVTLQKEMEVARTVQEALVAVPDLITRGRLQFAGHYQPASICGGDFWNYLELGPNKTLLIVGDVTGHGVPSALITASAKSCCDTLHAAFGSNLSITGLMQALNRIVYLAARRHLLMTCFATLIDLDEWKLVFASAGHPLPFIGRVGDDGQHTLQSLVARGNRLGDTPEWDFPAFSVDLRPGDTILWFTDGLTEGEDRNGDQWGEKRLRRAMQPHCHRRADELRDVLIKLAHDFYDGVPPADDITLVVGKIL
ncbi:MAG: SpoIIE family protein phosphatase [Deltaproteobacteria bacterium]|nr:SpoIIE family protein phosphatase [Deltaproteobacteria bacterium]